MAMHESQGCRLFFECIACGTLIEAPPFADELSHVIWQLTIEVHLIASSGMGKPQCLGMKSLTGTNAETILNECAIGCRALAAQYLRATITLIAE